MDSRISSIVYHMIKQEEKIRRRSYEAQMDELMDYFSVKDLSDEEIDAMIEELRKAGANHLIDFIRLRRKKYWIEKYLSLAPL